MDGWKCVSFTVAADLPEYRLCLEEFSNGTDQMVFLHINVHQWSKFALRKMQQDFKLLRQCVTCPLYAFAGTDAEEKWEHFVSLFGFRPLPTNIVCANGLPRQLFIHTPKDAPQNEHG